MDRLPTGKVNEARAAAEDAKKSSRPKAAEGKSDARSRTEGAIQDPNIGSNFFINDNR
jgi:hypothetical protein